MDAQLHASQQLTFIIAGNFSFFELFRLKGMPLALQFQNHCSYPDRKMTFVTVRARARARARVGQILNVIVTPYALACTEFHLHRARHIPNN